MACMLASIVRRRTFLIYDVSASSIFEIYSSSGEPCVTINDVVDG